MDGARAAKPESATELRAGHTQDVAHHPEHWRIVVDIDAVHLPVDSNGEGHKIPLRSTNDTLKHTCDQISRAKPNPLDDGIGRYFGITLRDNHFERKHPAPGSAADHAHGLPGATPILALVCYRRRVGTLASNNAAVQSTNARTLALRWRLGG